MIMGLLFSQSFRKCFIQNKSVFIIFYQGEQLRGRVKKICESLKATIYPCPENPQERREVAMGVMTRISDLENVLNTTNEQRNRILAQVARNIRVWFIKVFSKINILKTEKILMKNIFTIAFR